METKILGSIFLSGIVVLIGAILANLIAKSLEIQTWFDFLDSVSKNGFSSAISSLHAASIIFLFLVYPFALGFFVWLSIRWFY